MDRIKDTFTRCAAENRKALVAYLTAGYPDRPTSSELIEATVKAGADIIELGVPFSDPMADGPVIQHAGTVALNAGITFPDILGMARELRAAFPALPIVLFSYYNVLLAHGIERLAADCAEIGIDAVLAVDVPYEEQDEILPPLKRHGIHLIPLLAPTTPAERAAMILKNATGFAYYITVKGVTGARAELPPDLAARLLELKKLSPIPLVAGFGISSPEMAKVCSEHADGVVVGSAIVRLVEQSAASGDAVGATSAFVASLAGALR